MSYQMSTKELYLPLNPNPPIRVYLHHAYPLSILSSTEEYLPWFRSNFVQLYSGGPDHIDFLVPMLTHADHPQIYYSPLLNVVRLNRKIVDLINADSEIWRFIVDCITEGFYVDIEVDEYHVPFTRAFHNFHTGHSLLIHGYNTAQEKFSAIGYDRNGKYGIQLVDFASTLKAYGSRESKNHMAIVSHALRQKTGRDSNIQCEFTLELVVDMLKDYIHSINTLDRLKLVLRSNYRSNSLRFGIEAVRKLRFEPSAANAPLDLRPSHCLWEHKKCMAERVQYLVENGYLDKVGNLVFEFGKIAKMAESLRLLAIKYNLQKQRKILHKMDNLRNKIVEGEKFLIKNLLDRLPSCP